MGLLAARGVAWDAALVGACGCARRARVPRQARRYPRTAGEGVTGDVRRLCRPGSARLVDLHAETRPQQRQLATRRTDVRQRQAHRGAHRMSATTAAGLKTTSASPGVTRDDRLRDVLAVVGPAALAAVLCLIDVTSRSLGFDEAASVTIA